MVPHVMKVIGALVFVLLATQLWFNFSLSDNKQYDLPFCLDGQRTVLLVVLERACEDDPFCWASLNYKRLWTSRVRDVDLFLLREGVDVEPLIRSKQFGRGLTNNVGICNEEKISHTPRNCFADEENCRIMTVGSSVNERNILADEIKKIWENSRQRSIESVIPAKTSENYYICNCTYASPLSDRKACMNAISELITNDDNENLDNVFAPFKITNTNSANLDALPRIALVVVVSDYQSKWVNISIENKREYSRKHGYDFILSEHSKSSSYHPAWSKPPTLINLLKSQKYDWIWQIDLDTIITNIDLPVHHLIPRKSWYKSNLSYSEPNLNEIAKKYPVGDFPELLASDHVSLDLRIPKSAPILKTSDVQFILGIDCSGVNTGSMFLRNSPWTIAFLSQVSELRDQNETQLRKINIWWEQAALRWIFENGQEALFSKPDILNLRRTNALMNYVNLGRIRADSNFTTERIQKLKTVDEFASDFHERIQKLVIRRQLDVHSNLNDFRDQVDNIVKSRFIFIPQKWTQANIGPCNYAWKEGDFVVHFPGLGNQRQQYFDDYLARSHVEFVDSSPSCRCCFNNMNSTMSGLRQKCLNYYATFVKETSEFWIEYDKKRHEIAQQLVKVWNEEEIELLHIQNSIENEAYEARLKENLVVA
ncbi:hypothetical protein HK096_008892 [Nowakowskiella sp. JEL0078]|nr:hypothetical protein HK096_008892 [Nowakowskiella sp. JEL0078]